MPPPCRFPGTPGALPNSRTPLPQVDGGIQLVVRSSVDYGGYKFAFSAVGAKRHHGGHEVVGSYKSGFNVTTGSSWQTVTIPFKHFSSDWSDFTGECSTKDPTNPPYQHHCCSADHPEVCPNAKTLALIDGFGIWAEGTAGQFHLELKSISAVDAATVAAAR